MQWLKLLFAPHICLWSERVYIANNMNTDQTAGHYLVYIANNMNKREQSDQDSYCMLPLPAVTTSVICSSHLLYVLS